MIVLTVLVIPAFPARAQPAVSQRPADTGVLVERNLMIRVRDGVRLAADVYRPARDGKPLAGRFPALLTRTPYDKSGSSGEGNFYAARGYVVVANDTRGRYASEGTWHGISDDPQDGQDVVEWIAAQSWSDGKVGTFGTSYPGGTQHALAEMNPTHLTAMVPIDALSNCGVSGMRHGGAFELRFMNWIFQIGAPNGKAALANPSLRQALIESGLRIRQHADSLPVRPGDTPLRVVPEYEAWLVEAMSSGPEAPFWHMKGMSVVDHIKDYADVPVLHVTGWYDSWTRQVTMNYEALSKAKKSLQRLVIGPWTHGSQGSNIAGEVEFTADAAIDLLAFRLHWYDRWLRGINNGVDGESPVLLYVMGSGDDRRSGGGRLKHGGFWRAEREWPLTRARATVYHLHGDGRLAEARPEQTVSRTTYTFDPLHPVPTVGGNISSNQGLITAGGYDQRPREDTHAAGNRLPLSERRDVLVFRSEPAVSRPGSDRDCAGQALDQLDCPRYRLDGQARRRDPTECRLPARIRPESRRLDLAVPLSRGSRSSGSPAQAGRSGTDHDHALPDFQHFQDSPPDSPRCLEQQLSAVRREPQHRRSPGRLPPDGSRR